MGILEYLINGNLTISQEMINKFLIKLTEENKLIQNIRLTINQDLIQLAATVAVSETDTFDVNLTMSLGDFNFDRNSRFIVLLLQEPVLINYRGLKLKTRLAVSMEPDAASHIVTPEHLLRLMEYLVIEEDKLTINFNQVPGFKQLLQQKMGFLLNNLEIARLELAEEKLIVQPVIKLF
ncbi:MAG: hypothetical protein ACOX0T_11895 [Pelotomaculum sp.]|jgi:hypothetical protein